MLGSNNFQREESEIGISVRRTESPTYSNLGNNDPNSLFNSGEIGTSTYAEHGNNSGGTDFSVEFSRLSGELNQRIIREMYGLMKSVSIQIQGL